MGLDLRSIDIGCDGSTSDAQQQVSQYTDFPALIESLKRANDWKATESFSCAKDLSRVDDYNSEFTDYKRASDCFNKCVEQYQSICQSKSFPIQ